MTTEPEEDDLEDDPWLRQFLAGAEAKEQRSKQLAWGCAVPIILVVILALLAIANPH